MENSNTAVSMESLTEDSFAGYSFESLLDESEVKPTLINGGKVRYFDGKQAYLPNVTKQVQIQMSKLGLNISGELLLEQVKNFNKVNHVLEFGQYDISWVSGKNNCSVSVHTGDDIFEISCWY